MSSSRAYKKKEILDDSATTPATVHGFVNGFFPGNLWDIMLWMWSSGKITSCRQVARHGWVRDMCRWKATGYLAGMTTSLALRTPMADSRRFFAEVLPVGLS